MWYNLEVIYAMKWEVAPKSPVCAVLREFPWSMFGYKLSGKKAVIYI